MLELIGNGRRDRRDSAAHWLELGQVWGNVSALMRQMRRGGGDAGKNKEQPDTEIRAGRRKGRPGSRQKSGTSSAFFIVTHDSHWTVMGSLRDMPSALGGGVVRE